VKHHAQTDPVAAPSIAEPHLANSPDCCGSSHCFPFIAAGRWPRPSALPSWRTAGGEGGSGNTPGWCGRRSSRATARRIAVAGERGRRAPFPSKARSSPGKPAASRGPQARPRERSSPGRDETPKADRSERSVDRARSPSCLVVHDDRPQSLLLCEVPVAIANAT
jgi:hypothetical protein